MNAAAARQLVPIDQIADMLGAQARALAGELLPRGHEHAGDWWIGGLDGQPTRHAGSHGSMRVQLRGAHAGSWKDFASGEAGDALDLVAQVLFRGDKRAALAWARRWLGLDTRDPAALATARRESEQRAERVAEAEAADAERQRRLAHRRWLEAQPMLRGTPVESYLAGRGIDLAALGRLPGAIRFHPRLHCVEAGGELPAMVTAIGGPGGFLAIHRTWLEQAGPDDWRKARLAQPKKVLGRYAGGCISLRRGASGRSLGDMPAGEMIDVTEGIEDGLSVALADPAARVIAAVSLSNLAALHLPPQAGGLRIWRQNDTERAAIAAFDRAVSALLARGLVVLVPQIPAAVKDVNEWLTA